MTRASTLELPLMNRVEAPSHEADELAGGGTNVPSGCHILAVEVMRLRETSW